MRHIGVCARASVATTTADSVPAEVAAVIADHVLLVTPHGERWCHKCYAPWPCPTSRLGVLLADYETQLQRQATVLRGLQWCDLLTGSGDGLYWRGQIDAALHPEVEHP